MPNCLECKHEKPPFTTCFECETAIMRAVTEGAMRTCETCQHEMENGGSKPCLGCVPGFSVWEPKLAVQLAAKDKIIEGLVDVCKLTLVAVWYKPEHYETIEAIRAAIAAAKEE